MPRRNSEARRQQIAEALMVVMAEQGYARATVARIARQAGLAPGLVHYHFADKAEILAEMVDLLGARLAARIAAADAEPWAAVDAWVDGMLDPATGDLAAAGAWASVGGEALHQPAVRARYADWLSRLRDDLSARLAAAGVADAPDRATGAVTWVEGFLHVGLSAPGFVAPGSAAPVLKAWLRSGGPHG